MAEVQTTLASAASVFPGWPTPSSSASFPVVPGGEVIEREREEEAQRTKARAAAAAAAAHQKAGDKQQDHQRAGGASATSADPAATNNNNNTATMGKNKGGKGGGGGAAGAGGEGDNPEDAIPISLRGSNLPSASLRDKIKVDKQPYAFPFGPSSGGEHCWSDLDATTFNIRGPTYLEDKVKVPSQESMFDLMHFEMFRSKDRIGNVAARPDSFLRLARKAGDTRYYLVVVYVTPATPFIHLALYFAVQPERARAAPHFAKLWEQFTAHGPEADAFRDERWKVIPRVAEGSWIVSSAVGSKPALLAQKLVHTWIICDGTVDSPSLGAGAVVATSDAGCGPTPGSRARGGSFSTMVGPGPYLEADCDVASSNMAYVLVGLLQSYAKHIVIDLGFAIEPREDECLPEVVLGSVRLSRINVDRPPEIDALPQDWILGTNGDEHGGGGGGGGDGGGDGEEEGEDGGGGAAAAAGGGK